MGINKMNKLIFAISLASAVLAVELAIDDPFVEINVETPEYCDQTTNSEEYNLTATREEDEQTVTANPPDITGYWDLTYYEVWEEDEDWFKGVVDTYFVQFNNDLSATI